MGSRFHTTTSATRELPGLEAQQDRWKYASTAKVTHTSSHLPLLVPLLSRRFSLERQNPSLARSLAPTTSKLGHRVSLGSSSRIGLPPDEIGRKTAAPFLSSHLVSMRVGISSRDSTTNKKEKPIGRISSRIFSSVASLEKVRLRIPGSVSDSYVSERTDPLDV